MARQTDLTTPTPEYNTETFSISLTLLTQSLEVIVKLAITMAELYHYTPLPDENYIRLLYLEPGTKGEAGRCQLRIVNLDNAPSSEALSYCWGNSNFAFSISVDGEGAISLTFNLVSALERVRHENEVRVLWADAICIYSDQRKIKDLEKLRFDRLIYKGFLFYNIYLFFSSVLIISLENKIRHRLVKATMYKAYLFY